MAPTEVFSNTNAGPAPDYSDARFWAALPDAPDEADLVVPGDAYGDRQASADVDVFYIHPTTYFDKRHWNQAFAAARPSSLVDHLLLPLQASAFNACCRVYAPRYRQATLGAYLVPPDQGVAAFTLAYLDIENAFKYYIEHANAGRPFIIAAHSQGSMHAERLLELIDGSALRERLVAAYIIGYNLPLNKFGSSYHHLKACERADDTGCVVAWDTFVSDAVKKKPYDALHWYGETLQWVKRDVPANQALCSNPLSWSSDGSVASAELHLGAMPVGLNRSHLRRFYDADAEPAPPMQKLQPLLPHYCAARCHNGRLYVPMPKDATFADQVLDGSLHTADYNLFYMNIRVNACERAAAFVAHTSQH